MSDPRCAACGLTFDGPCHVICFGGTWRFRFTLGLGRVVLENTTGIVLGFCVRLLLKLDVPFVGTVATRTGALLGTRASLPSSATTHAGRLATRASPTHCRSCRCFPTLAVHEFTFCPLLFALGLENKMAPGESESVASELSLPVIFVCAGFRNNLCLCLCRCPSTEHARSNGSATFLSPPSATSGLVSVLGSLKYQERPTAPARTFTVVLCSEGPTPDGDEVAVAATVSADALDHVSSSYQRRPPHLSPLKVWCWLLRC